MPAGGARPGAGRKKGVPNKRTAEAQAASHAAVSVALGAVSDVFDGDAHALLMLVYKDRNQPMDLRLDAAKAAVRYEKPALAAIDVTQDINATVRDVTDQPITVEQWSDEVRARH